MSDDKKSDQRFLRRLVGVFMLAAIGGMNNPYWTDEADARATLEHHGFKPETVGGYAWFAGTELYKTKFTAIDQNGQTVKGIVFKAPISGSRIQLLNP